MQAYQYMVRIGGAPYTVRNTYLGAVDLAKQIRDGAIEQGWDESDITAIGDYWYVELSHPIHGTMTVDVVAA